MRSRLLLTLLLTSVAANASAQELRSVPPTPQDFSWQWPLSIKSNDDLVRVSLNAEVYARLWRDDVGDVVVFNGANEPVSMAPMRSLRSAQATMASSATSLLDVPLFRLPAGTPKNSSERVRLVVSQGADGRLQRLDAQVGVEPLAAPSSDWLMDLSMVHAPVRGLTVGFEPGAAPLVARVDVFGSRDLSSWTRLAAGQALVSLDEDGMRLERRRVEFANTQLPYLRLVRTDASEPLPIATVQVTRVLPGVELEPGLESVELTGHGEAVAGVYRYSSSGPFPVERVNLELADRNSATTVIVESRMRADLPWRERARGAVFRLAGQHGQVESAALDISRVRDREWRVRTEPAQLKAPILVLSYRPDQFAFLAQGDGPFRLAAGSARSRRSDAPLAAVAKQLQADKDARWSGAEAQLGRGAELAGGAALAPRPDGSGSPTPWQWLLWALLLAGAFAVVAMVLKLLRQSGA
ncbi:MAG TPA: DUF3999 family protein [Chiayiivirga sp.]|nr:DUF3999 family protein [Chiayiivirga sp.]